MLAQLIQGSANRGADGDLALTTTSHDFKGNHRFPVQEGTCASLGERVADLRDLIKPNMASAGERQFDPGDFVRGLDRRQRPQGLLARTN